MIENYILVKKLALKIYNKDEHRATLLVNSTREIVEKIYESNNLYMDTLIENIKNDLKIVPRYAHKIDLDALKTIVNLTEDIDTAHYQHNIVEFLENLKKETLSKKNSTAK
jgi:D-mannonate dehydratase